MKKLFLSITLLFGPGLSAATDEGRKESKIQQLCALFMEKHHPCHHQENDDESILEELAKRGILEYNESKSTNLCIAPPVTDE